MCMDAYNVEIWWCFVVVVPTIAADFTKWPGVFLTSRVMRSCESTVRLCSFYNRINKELCTLDISLIYSSDTDIINDVKRDMV